ncbi:MAG: phosphatidate cytidylyltransferase [Clostridiales bacterium]|nr:phosphatidate cytidylyltransferase [Clostridiales bacterium]
MLVRILTAVIGLPLLIFIVWLGGVPLALAVYAISVLGMYEFYKAVSGSLKPIHSVGFMMEALLVLSLFLAEFSAPALAFEFLGLFFILLMFLVFKHDKYTVVDAAVTVFGFLYIGALLSTIIVLRQESIFYVWFAVIFAFASDTGAYFSGVTLGKHKLAPVLSPKKSIEGAVGGLIASALVTVIYGLFAFKQSSADVLFIGYMAAFGGIGSVLAQLGDLTASSIKRKADIKDYGNIFPGHGGVLDRFDSVLFTAPFALAGCYIIFGMLWS